MDPSRILESFVRHLRTQPQVLESYAKRLQWTRLASAALVATGQDLFGKHLDVAAIGRRSSKNRSEHLSLDVTVYEKDSGQIRFIAEHEMSSSPDAIKYQAWKLLHVVADVRVHVSYCGGMSRRPALTRAKIIEEIRLVAGRLARGPIVSIIGDLHANPDNLQDLQSVFEVCAIGSYPQ